MKIIESNVELLKQESGLAKLYEHIEDCGRTCYKSEGNKKEGSAEKFVNAMIKSHHGAMLEHGTVYLAVPINTVAPFDENPWVRYAKNPFSKVGNGKFTENYGEFGKVFDVDGEQRVAVTTNYRVLVENGWLDDLKYMCDATENHEKRYTLRIVCDRGVTHELVRHRTFSFAQESSRYCNYGDDKKFGQELTFICPSWANYESLINMANVTTMSSRVVQNAVYDLLFVDVYEDNTEVSIESANQERGKLMLVYDMLKAEKNYMYMISHGFQPQQARQVLPTMIKSEICMTGYASDWRFFFDLRLFGKTGQPHPDMLRIAQLAKEKFEEAGYWDEIMSYKSKFDE